jgi:hypothetical protein
MGYSLEALEKIPRAAGLGSLVARSMEKDACFARFFHEIVCFLHIVAITIPGASSNATRPADNLGMNIVLHSRRWHWLVRFLLLSDLAQPG